MISSVKSYQKRFSAAQWLLPVIVLTVLFGFWKTPAAAGQILSVMPFSNKTADADFPQLSGADAVRFLKHSDDYDLLLAQTVRDSLDNESPVDSAVSSTFSYTAKLTASDGASSDYFGSVGIAIDGDTAVIGASGDDFGTSFDQGSVYVFVRTGLTWSLQQKLTASDGASSDGFGSYVSISGDTIVVGTYLDDVGTNSNQGSAYVFVRTGNTWTQQAKLTASDGSGGDWFGYGVSVSNDTIAVDAYNDNNGANINHGSVYIFVRSGTTWTQQTKLTVVDGGEDNDFAGSVAIDGDTVVIGAPEAENGTSFHHGAAYVFVRSGTTWTQQAKLTAVGAYQFDNESFGISVAIENDRIVVGASEFDVKPQTDQGAAFVFVRNGATWNHDGTLIAEDGTRYDNLARSVGVSNVEVIAGAYGVDIGANSSQGAAYVFKRSTAGWTQQTKFVAPDGTFNHLLGQAAAIDEGTMMVGAPNDNNSRGAVYVLLDTTSSPDLQATSDSGSSNADNITNSRNLSFDIGEVPIGSTVELLRDGALITSVVATASVVTLSDNNPPENGNFRYASRLTLTDSTVFRSTPTIITLDTINPTGSINQAAGQIDPTRNLPVNFTAVFSEPVVGFAVPAVSLAGSTANVASAVISVSGGNTTFSVSVGNFTSNGQVLQATILPGWVGDLAGNNCQILNNNDNSVTVDNVRPSVTLDQAEGQADPTVVQPINFTVVFSEPVTGFNNADISLSGSTANVATAAIVVTGSGTTYNVAVSSITSPGLVTARVFANAAQDALGNLNTASSSTDNSITINLKRAVFDFDGDGKTDVGIFRPSDGSWWYSRSSDSQFRVYSFGVSTDTIVPSDFTGDGRTDLAVFRPSTGEWFIQRSEDNSFFSFPFGANGDIPAPADYDGDGRTDAAVFRPGSGTWFILNSGGSGTSIVNFGTTEDKPVAADFDGDGKSDIAIFRPSDGSWWYLQSSNAQFKVFRFGVSTDKPVPGDYTGDGKADLAIWRPSTGEWFIQRSEDNSFYSVPFGASGDIPVAGDYDGDGKFDTAVFRPSTANWFVNRSAAGILITNFGATGDRPIPNAFVP